MLKTLQIKDYALIENIFVTFKKGLNIITGETGAGKSIIIGALSLILGERADSDAVRNGKNKAVIEGIFDNSGNETARKFLISNEIEIFDELIIRREVSIQGKSRAFINDTPVSVSTLKLLGNLLVDLHGQHQHQSLLYPENHLHLLDEIAGNENLLQQFGDEYKRFYLSVIDFKKMIANANNVREKKEFYEFQLKEINEVSPEKNEDEKLKSELKILENSEKLFSTSSEIFQRLYEDENAIYNQLNEIAIKLSELNKIDASFSEKEEDFNSALILIGDVAEYLRNYQNGIDISPERLEEIRERLGALLLLKKKFGGSIDSVLKNKEKIENELSLVENFDEEIKRQKNNIEKIRTKLSKLANEISISRKSVVNKISAGIKKQLENLGIPEANFDVRLTKKLPGTDEDYYVIINNQKFKLLPNGVDTAEFYISTNIGEELKPLSKVASGGEISRIMLAIKSVLARKDKLPLLVFDEIDTGVSGRIAQKVGKSMKELAVEHQIIAITHLPQIAAQADSHFQVQKIASNGRVLSTITELDEENKIEEIAKLLSGESISNKALETAKLLLNND